MSLRIRCVHRPELFNHIQLYNNTYESLPNTGILTGYNLDLIDYSKPTLRMHRSNEK